MLQIICGSNTFQNNQLGFFVVILNNSTAYLPWFIPGVKQLSFIRCFKKVFHVIVHVFRLLEYFISYPCYAFQLQGCVLIS